MPTNLNNTFTNGDVIEPEHVQQFIEPINNLESGRVWFGDAGSPSGSTTDDYSVTVNPDASTPYPVVLQPGFILHMKMPNAANTKPVNVDVNGSGPTAVKKRVNQDLVSGDLPADAIVSMMYDGTVFQLLGGQELQAVDLPDGIDAAKIGAGTVSNTEFDHLDGLVANIQEQIDLLAGGGGGGGGGPVTLNGLVDVTISSPATGEYLRKSSGDWVNSALQAGYMPTGIDAAKLSGGSVSNTEFDYLSGLTSAIQTQLDQMWNGGGRLFCLGPTLVDGKTLGTTALGTIPTGRSLAPLTASGTSHLLVAATTGISGTGTRPTFKLGTNGAHDNLRTAAAFGPTVNGAFATQAASATTTLLSGTLYCEVTNVGGAGLTSYQVYFVVVGILI